MTTSAKFYAFDSELALLAFIYVTATLADGRVTPEERAGVRAFFGRRYPEAGERLTSFLADARARATAMDREERLAHIDAAIPSALADLSAEERATLGDEIMQLAWCDHELSPGERDLAVHLTRAFARHP
ncbi:MAG: TerB family tellurite resistance protein [Myxococcales bacterium]|nr:TerB family tellurite resistance protein [Myxococcales bacterium]